jgi:hypothetical protein
MNKIWQKGCAMLLASFMVLTALAIFATPAKADVSASRTGGRMGWTLDWVDAWMTDDPMLDADDENITFNYDNNAGSMYYLGDDEADVELAVYPNAWDTTMTYGGHEIDSEDGWWVNFTLQDADTGDIVSLGDETFWSFGPGEDNYPDFGANWEANQTGFVTFTIDIADEGVVESGEYPLSVRITYRNESMTAAQPAILTDTIDLSVYVSSIFHDDDDDDAVDTMHEFTFKNQGQWADWNVRDSSEDNDWDDGTPMAFEAGDTFEPAILFLDLDPPYNPLNLGVTLTAPTDDGNGDGLADISLVNTEARAMGYAGGAVEFNFRVNVQAGTPPGITQGTATFDFIRDDHGYDQNIVEDTRDVDFLVDFNFRDTDAFEQDEFGNYYSENALVSTEVNITDIGEETPEPPVDDNTTNETGNGTRQIDIFDLPSDVYQQSTFSDKLITVDVTVENNGNHDLYNVEFWFDPLTNTPGQWDFFRNPNFFWPTTAGPSYDTTRLFLEEFPVGHTEIFTIQVTVVKEVPIGEHRLPIFYEGFYFNDGSLIEDTGFFATNDGEPLTVYFSIFVEDDVMDCRVESVALDSDDYEEDLTDLWIEVGLENLEGYAFIDIMATADFTGTPFYAPLITDNPNEGNDMVQVVDADEMVDYWEPYSADPTYIYFYFNVDMYVEPTPDKYPFDIHLTAIIQETLEPVETILTGYFTITGYGPRIYIEAFTTSEIEAGNFFDLNLTIANDGDDDLRDAWVYIGADGTYPVNWHIICDFIGQIQRESASNNLTGEYAEWQEFYYDYTSVQGEYAYVEDGGFSSSNEWDGAEVTLEALDIDSAKEIVALNLYIEGVYSSPGAVITLMYIGTIAAGETVQVDYQMMADKDMVDGKPYVIEVEVWGIDSEADDPYYDYFDITVKTSNDDVESYEPVEVDYFMGGMQVMGLVLFIVIVVAVLFYVLRKVVFPPKKEEPKAPQ